MSSSVCFDDRLDAGRQLARQLLPLQLRCPLVLAIPRGAIPIGAIIADALHGDLDVVLVHKLGAPFNPEYAIGAIDEFGNVQLGPDADPGSPWVREESARQLAVLKQRRALFSAGREALDPLGRSVIVVDDGLATGSTMAAALRATRTEMPLALIAAVPVASPEALELIGPLADRVVCLHAPPDFRAVGQFYRAFPQVDENEAVRMVRSRQPGDHATPCTGGLSDH
ncbi:phosphoribosyltransferase family protein [Pseudoduganella ginsengisoli]|uniref:Phosphoribosyltransferase n=1 Tax=Pseudoduganella ginsengisoli TaxID=1462440 RepID=A0A6L6PW21_9BURK|nr:phosphoribosyltransferase family protein [Pseudoduganella ginsengisoli]MTW01439.1 phosphoribosyltransferase [Pseudoduganella ginsengisoli]